MNWHLEEMAAVVAFALDRGWEVATHAVGDRTVRTVLDGYEKALAAHPELAPATLTVLLACA
jgi:predicted amidohydrolase YtcJ